MRTSFLQKTMFLAALVLGLYSCNKDGNDAPKPNDVAATTKTVTLKFSDPSTYYDDQPMSNKTPALTSGTIYFVAGAVVVHTATFVTGDVTALKGAGKDYTVPSSVSKVYIVADAGSASALPTLPASPLGATLASIKTTAMKISEQTNPISKIALQGEGDVSANAVNVNLYPAVARIEIKEITVKPAGAGVNFPLTNFELHGIFMNNTFKELGFDYTTIPTNAAVKYTAAGDFANTGYPAWLYDYSIVSPYLGGATASKKSTVGTGRVWAYQVFPAKVEAITGAGKVPQIVFKMQNITVPALSLAFNGTQFLTVSDFLNGSVPITEFEPGKVYIINQIAFAGEHLSPTPGVPTKTKLKVNVTVKDWVPITTTPDI